MKKDYLSRLNITEKNPDDPENPDVSYFEGTRDTYMDIIETLNEKIDYVRELQKKENNKIF